MTDYGEQHGVFLEGGLVCTSSYIRNGQVVANV